MRRLAAILVLAALAGCVGRGPHRKTAIAVNLGAGAAGSLLVLGTRDTSAAAASLAGGSMALAAGVGLVANLLLDPRSGSVTFTPSPTPTAGP